MAEPNWQRTLQEVLRYKTVKITKTSPRTGNTYQTDAIIKLRLFSTGEVSEHKRDGKIDGFTYHVVDNRHNLDYSITIPEKLEVKFGSVIEFTNIVGGPTSNGGWYHADKGVLIK